MAKKRSKSKRNRVEFLKEMYLPKIKESEHLRQEIGREFEGLKILDENTLFQAFENADPSNNKKFLVWMLERFLKQPTVDGLDDAGRPIQVPEGKRLLVEDLEKTAGFLDFFDKFNDKFDENKRNVNDYMSVDDFFDVVELKMPKEGDFMSASQMERQYKKEIDIWLDNETWKVVVPKSHAASIAYGKDSRWCTAMTNDSQYDYHTKKGPLIILINKKADPNERRTHKFQFHFETDQYMDAQDKRVSYLDMLSSDKDLLNAFLKNVSPQYTLPIRLKLNLEIPKESLHIKDTRKDKSDSADKFTLNLSDMKADTLPDGLEIEGHLKIEKNKNIKTLQNLKVHGDLLIEDSSIELIGENVYVGGLLNASKCKNLNKIVDGLEIGEDGTLDVKYCDNLEALPNNLVVKGNIYASFCPKIVSVPENIEVKWALYMRDTGLSKLIKEGKIENPKDKVDYELYCDPYA